MMYAPLGSYRHPDGVWLSSVPYRARALVPASVRDTVRPRLHRSPRAYIAQHILAFPLWSLFVLASSANHNL